jgi:hypothetical protein
VLTTAILLAAVVRDLLAKEGILGLYKGMSAALPLTLHSAIHWAVYHQMREFVINTTNTPLIESLVGLSRLRSYSLCAIN